MKTLRIFPLMSTLLVLTSAALAAHAQQPQPSPTSATSSPTSDTRVSNGELRRENGELKKVSNSRSSALNSQLVNACAAAADELAASRKLIDALDDENTALSARLETE